MSVDIAYSRYAIITSVALRPTTETNLPTLRRALISQYGETELVTLDEAAKLIPYADVNTLKRLHRADNHDD